MKSEDKQSQWNKTNNTQKEEDMSNHGRLETIQNNVLVLFLARLCKVWTMGLGVFMHTSKDIMCLLVTPYQQTIETDENQFQTNV